MTDGDGVWKGLNKALTVCSLISDVLSNPNLAAGIYYPHISELLYTLHFSFQDSKLILIEQIVDKKIPSISRRGQEKDASRKV